MSLTLITLTHSLSRQAGGLFESVRRLSQSVAATGVDVRVLGLIDSDFERDRAAWAPLEPRALQPYPPRRLGWAPGLTRALADSVKGESVVHLHGLWKWTSWACLRAARRERVSRIVSPRGMLEPWAMRRGRMRKVLAAALYERRNVGGAPCLHALNEAELAQIRRFGARGPVAVIPNGVDLPPAAGTEPRDAANGGGNDDRPTMLFLSRVHPKKGLRTLIDAWALVRGSLNGWRLVVAGPDEVGHRASLEARVRELGLDSAVRFVGPQYGPAKAQWLARAHVFVLPSFSEGFPMAVLEALAFGVPALVTPHCHMEQAVAAGAAVCTAPEPGPLSEALRELAGLSEAERLAMGRAGRRLVEASFTWERIAGQMLAVYEWLAGGGPPPAQVVGNQTSPYLCSRDLRSRRHESVVV